MTPRYARTRYPLAGFIAACLLCVGACRSSRATQATQAASESAEAIEDAITTAGELGMPVSDWPTFRDSIEKIESIPINTGMRNVAIVKLTTKQDSSDAIAEGPMPTPRHYFMKLLEPSSDQGRAALQGELENYRILKDGRATDQVLTPRALVTLSRDQWTSDTALKRACGSGRYPEAQGLALIYPYAHGAEVALRRRNNDVRASGGPQGEQLDTLARFMEGVEARRIARELQFEVIRGNETIQTHLLKQLETLRGTLAKLCADDKACLEPHDLQLMVSAIGDVWVFDIESLDFIEPTEQYAKLGDELLEGLHTALQAYDASTEATPHIQAFRDTLALEGLCYAQVPHDARRTTLSEETGAHVLDDMRWRDSPLTEVATLVAARFTPWLSNTQWYSSMTTITHGSRACEGHALVVYEEAVLSHALCLPLICPDDFDGIPGDNAWKSMLPEDVRQESEGWTDVGEVNGKYQVTSPDDSVYTLDPKSMQWWKTEAGR